MSDTVFTPDERAGLPDPAVTRSGHRTENIVLADDAEYSLAGDRQDGVSRIASKQNQPFEGTYQVSFRDDEAKMKYRVKKNDIAASAWSVTTNVITVTVLDNHKLRTGQWVTLGQFPSASTFPSALENTAIQITAINDLTFTAALTTGDDSATEAFQVQKSDVRMQPGEGEVLFSGVLADNEDINLGVLRAGRYRMVSPGTLVHDTWFVSDGTTIDMEIEGTIAGDVSASVAYIAAESATLQSLHVSGGDLLVNNGAGVATTIQVDYYPDEFFDTDVDGKMCFFEKDGDLIIRNRTGASVTAVLESIRARVSGRISSSASLLPAEHPEA